MIRPINIKYSNYCNTKLQDNNKIQLSKKEQNRTLNNLTNQNITFKMTTNKSTNNKIENILKKFSKTLLNKFFQNKPELKTSVKSNLYPIEKKEVDNVTKNLSEIKPIINKTTKTIANKNKENELITNNKKNLKSINEYDPITGILLRKTILDSDEKTITNIIEYDPTTGNKIKEIENLYFGITNPDYICTYKYEYNPITKRKLKETAYKNKNCTEVLNILEYDSKSGNILKEVFYDKEGKNIEWIKKYNYDPVTANKIRMTHYEGEEKSIYTISDYDPITGKEIKLTSYQDDGKNIRYIADYNPINGKMIKLTTYQTGSDCINKISEYHKDTGCLLKKTEYKTTNNSNLSHKIKETTYQSDDRYIDNIIIYDEVNGNKIKQTGFYKNSNTVKYIIEYDSKTNNISKEIIFHLNGNTVERVTYYNPETKEKILEYNNQKLMY